MGKKKEGYLYLVRFSCDDYRENFPKLGFLGHTQRKERRLSKAIHILSKKEPKPKYQMKPGADYITPPKEWR